MQPYPEIKNVYRRDPLTDKVILGNFSLPEFKYLYDCEWIATEKIDGVNIRVMWFGASYMEGAENRMFADRRSKGEIPPLLLRKLKILFPERDLLKWFGYTDVCLYGEGFGAGIRKGGDRYISADRSFALFDTYVPETDESPINGWWLDRAKISAISLNLEIPRVPVINRSGDAASVDATMTLHEAIMLVSSGLKSQYGDFEAEGLVLRPKVELYARNGSRIIVKVKARDFSIGGSKWALR